MMPCQLQFTTHQPWIQQLVEAGALQAGATRTLLLSLPCFKQLLKALLPPGSWPVMLNDIETAAADPVLQARLARCMLDPPATTAVNAESLEDGLAAEMEMAVAEPLAATLEQQTPAKEAATPPSSLPLPLPLPLLPTQPPTQPAPIMGAAPAPITLMSRAPLMPQGGCRVQDGCHMLCHCTHDDHSRFLYCASCTSSTKVHSQAACRSDIGWHGHMPCMVACTACLILAHCFVL